MIEGKALQLLVVGSVNWDYTAEADRLPRPGETVRAVALHECLGGKGANQAIAAARLGARVWMLARVGDDAAGREALRRLQAERVDVSNIAAVGAAPTGAALIVVDPTGQKQITCVAGANAALAPSDLYVMSDVLATCSAVVAQLEVPLDVVLAAFRGAKAAGALTVLDPAPALPLPDELYRLTDAIKPNATEAETLTGVRVDDRASAMRAATALLERGVGLVCLSAGDQGGLVATRTDQCWLGRIRVPTIDSTGAGDAFTAALAVALAEGQPARQAARFACAAAALSTTKLGAQAGLPARQAVEELLG